MTQRFLPFLLAFLLTAGIVSAQTAVFTIDVDTTGPNTEVTVYDNGSIFADLPWPLANVEAQLPPMFGLGPLWWLPSGLNWPISLACVPLSDDAGDVALACGVVMAGYVMPIWTQRGVQSLASVAEEIHNWLAGTPAGGGWADMCVQGLHAGLQGLADLF